MLLLSLEFADTDMKQLDEGFPRSLSLSLSLSRFPTHLLDSCSFAVASTELCSEAIAALNHKADTVFLLIIEVLNKLAQNGTVFAANSSVVCINFHSCCDAAKCVAVLRELKCTSKLM